jgi:hypothetical protein
VNCAETFPATKALSRRLILNNWAKALVKLIVMLQWLYECAAAREVVPLMPRHYIHISAPTLESMDDVSRFCDPCAL